MLKRLLAQSGHLYVCNNTVKETYLKTGFFCFHNLFFCFVGLENFITQELKRFILRFEIGHLSKLAYRKCRSGQPATHLDFFKAQKEWDFVVKLNSAKFPLSINTDKKCKITNCFQCETYFRMKDYVCTTQKGDENIAL